MSTTSLSVLLGLSLAAGGGCGAAPEEAAGPPGAVGSQGQPIINGANSAKGQFPSVVGLLLDAVTTDPMSPNPLMPKCIQGSGACTGTLIREDVILTASHCISNLLKMLPDPSCQRDPAPPKYTFEVDLIGAARDMRVIATAKAVAHPQFAPTMCTNPPSVSKWNDIALVFLKEPIKGVPLQKIAAPADAAALLKEGSKVRIVGYGKGVVDDDKSAGTQRFGTATLVKVGEAELQAGQMGEQQACQGDSGGPVLANPDAPPAQQVQIGVASRLRTQRCPGLLDLFNPPKCENGVFYTRVDTYYDWIQQTIAKEAPTPPTPADMSSDNNTPPDMASSEGEQPPPGKGGCKCDVGGPASTSASPTAAALVAGALLLLRLRRRPARG